MPVVVARHPDVERVLQCLVGQSLPVLDLRQAVGGAEASGEIKMQERMPQESEIEMPCHGSTPAGSASIVRTAKPNGCRKW